MPRPNTTVTFSGGTGSPAAFTVTAPSPNVAAAVTVPGVVNRTQAGSLVQFQVGAPYWEATLPLDHLSNADKANLEAFFRNNWHATWQYTDENGNVFNAQFLDSALPLTKLFRDLWSCRVRLNLSAVLK
ncbi:MAG TPA: hypothetical protein VGX76_15200 [Pirellulales bacterium]|nr:hypothetical protein [Pirellulales bacterium]